MKEFIERLSLGIVDYDAPVAVTDVENIVLSVKPEEVYQGGFNIYNEGKGKLKGVIFSSDKHLIIKTKTFSGEKTHIQFAVDSDYFKEDTIRKGKITIVSNGGEINIPFLIKVDSQSIESSIGEIKNMFHFANLVQENYNEALKIFISTKFLDVILRKEPQLVSKYHGLIGGVDKNIAMEEFLIAANKKKVVKLSIKQTQRDYENVSEDCTESIVIQKDTWGYVHRKIFVEGDFIQIDKRELNNEDFNGNICTLNFTIKKAALHSGYNFGRVTIKGHLQENIVNFKVHKKVNEVAIKGSPYIKEKRQVADLYRTYLEFRMKKIDMKVWTKKSLAVVTELLKTKDSMFLRIYKAQLLCAEKKDTECKVLLEGIGRELDGHFEKSEEVYAYYLYVKALWEKSEETTREALEKIREYRENGNESWTLLLIIMYLDESYDKNESLKLIRVKERFDETITSPLLFFEVINIYNRTPSLLRVLDNFEINALCFAVKYEFVSQALIARIVELCNKWKIYNREIFKLLTSLYELSKGKEVLESIVSMLIKGSKTHNKYFVWYERAVECDLKLTGLYEYYMYSIGLDYDKKLPDVILMYFVYNITLKGERLEFLYENVIKYRESSESIYKFYSKIIDKYVADCIIKGRVNDKLAPIYNIVLANATFAPEFSEKLPDILNTYMIQCDNKNMKEVIVTYNEIKKIEKIPLINGKAYIKLFSENASVVMEDINGNRYISSVSYKITKLLALDDLLKICYEINPDKLGLLIYFNDKYFKVRKYQDKAIEVMEKLVSNEQIRESYKIFLEKEIIDYYSANSNDEVFKKFLEEIKVEKYNIELIIKVIEFTITRGLYKEGFQMMVKYGCEYIEDSLIFRCVNAILQEQMEENKHLLYLAFYAFTKGKYDEHTLKYIGQYFYGGTEELYSVWMATKNFQCENAALEEKIIVQMLFTGEYGNHIGSVFSSYVSNGADYKVKQAYLIRKSYDYFVRESVIDDRVFQHIESELTRNEDVNYICMLAYVKYQSKQSELNDHRKSLCKDIIEQMCKRNKKYEFYKKFGTSFELPEGFADKTILEYRTKPDGLVKIHYLIDGAGCENEYRTEIMVNTCQGIYTFEYILFYGEKIKYYITEERGEESAATESREVTISRDHTWDDSSVFGMLNNMMMCREMQEENTLNELVTDYYEKKKLNESIFMTV